MNRRKNLLLVFVMAMMAIFLIYQGVVTAQEEGPQQGGDNAEPQDNETNNPEALVSNNFTYQGQLKSAGAPVNGNCDFIWDIYDVISGGTSLATDTDPNIPVSNGLFTAVIDVPSSVIDSRQLYLEIQVSCPTGSGSYTTLTPRQELRAVPYSLGVRLPFTETISLVGAPIFSITNSSTSTNLPSLLGSSAGGDGVRGLSTGLGSADNGVYGETNSTDAADAGVKGRSSSDAAGGYFSSASGNGVYGRSDSPTHFGGYFINPSAVTFGGALYAYGDAKQSLSGDGFIKAGVYLYCASADSLIHRFFNNVNTASITVTNGASSGRCTVDFGFDVSSRFVSALAWDNGARIVTFRTGMTNNVLDFFRYDAAGNGMDGAIMILIY